jgi:hypothetical protein
MLLLIIVLTDGVFLLLLLLLVLCHQVGPINLLKEHFHSPTRLRPSIPLGGAIHRHCWRSAMCRQFNYRDKPESVSDRNSQFSPFASCRRCVCLCGHITRWILLAMTISTDMTESWLPKRNLIGVGATETYLYRSRSNQIKSMSDRGVYHKWRSNDPLDDSPRCLVLYRSCPVPAADALQFLLRCGFHMLETV